MSFNIPVLLVGIVFVAAGIILLLKQLKSKKNCTAPVAGTVTDYCTEVHHDAEDGTDSYSYYPILRYYAAGQWFEERGGTGRARKKYDIGEQVELLYDPQHPECFIISEDKSGTVLALIAVVAGIGACVMSFFAK